MVSSCLSFAPSVVPYNLELHLSGEHCHAGEGAGAAGGAGGKAQLALTVHYVNRRDPSTTRLLPW